MHSCLSLSEPDVLVYRTADILGLCAVVASTVPGSANRRSPSVKIPFPLSSLSIVKCLRFQLSKLHTRSLRFEDPQLICARLVKAPLDTS